MVGATVVAASSRLDFGSPQDPGAGFLPMLTGVAILLLGGGVAVQEWRRRRPPAREGAPEPIRWRQVAMAVGALLAYWVLLERLGYLLTTLLVTGFLFRYVGRLRWVMAVSGTVAATALSYALFAVWLRIPLPRGLW